MDAIIIAQDYEEMCSKAAEFLAAQILLKPNGVLGLATGSTPTGVYERLCAKYAAGQLDFSDVRTVNLDEYAGLGPEDEQSYHAYMRRHLFDHVNLQAENTHLPDGLAPDPDEECVRYDELLTSLGGVDMQILGLGVNGHIGFNEPGDAFSEGSHVVTLSESTIAANARFFPDAGKVPRQALTMGMKAILGAKKILLLASGENKAQAVRDMLCGPITPRLPASILRLHPDVTFLIDSAAGQLLPIP